MNVTDEIKSNIHLYVILDLTIKSVQHDQKLLGSFKFHRPYVNRCERKQFNLEMMKILKDCSKEEIETHLHQIKKAANKRTIEVS